MLYNSLKENLMLAKKDKHKQATSDLIGVIDAVDKVVFAERKKAGEDFLVKDSVVMSVVKNQLKNINIAYEKTMNVVGAGEATDSMLFTINLLKSYLPPAIIEDELRNVIQGLGAKNIGQAMGLLKKNSEELGYDYDGAEASTIAKELFV